MSPSMTAVMMNLPEDLVRNFSSVCGHFHFSWHHVLGETPRMMAWCIAWEMFLVLIALPISWAFSQVCGCPLLSQLLWCLFVVFCHSVMGTKSQTFERKHSQWKLTQIPPMFPMAPSCINETLVQAASLQVHTVCPVKAKVPHFSSVHLVHLFNKWKESLNACSSFKKPLDSTEPHQPF